jgi:sulfoxide reductase heme-binding subunit YedZ
LAWAGGLAPLAVLAVRFGRDRLGVNPIETLLHWGGLSGLILLLAALSISPLRRATGVNELIKARRTLGLFAFFYAVLHFLTYAVVDQGLAMGFILEDIKERPYILVGTTALLILTPLALTSTRGWIRRLGRNWARLHRWVYVAAALGVLHFYWLVKADTREPLIYAAVLAGLLLVRVPAVSRRIYRR